MIYDSHVAVLGAGITGLSIAYALKKRGLDVTVYEKKEKPGGVIQSRRENGWLVEEGPNTMLVRDRRTWDLLDELELTNRIAKPGDKAKKRFIVRDGRPLPAPMSLVDFLKTDLISAGAKFRLLKEPFAHAPGYDDESIAAFIRRRLGPEPLEYGVNPFVSGIYAGDPEQLSIKHTFNSLFKMEQKHGSLTQGFWKRSKKDGSAKRALISFDGGIQLLPLTIARQLGDTLQLKAAVQSVSAAEGGWEIGLQNGRKEMHRAVVSTIPGHRLYEVWVDEGSRLPFRKLAQIEYAPMSVLALGFRREQIDHPLDGFGMLIPEKEPFSLLGCLFSSSLFASRAPGGNALLTCFIGGARNPEGAFFSIQRLIVEVMPQLQELLGAKGKPVFQHHTYWEKAIPQYTVGYDTYLETMRQIEDTNPGFYLAGNYRGGVSVPDCILNGFDMAKRVAKFFYDQDLS